MILTCYGEVTEGKLRTDDALAMCKKAISLVGQSQKCSFHKAALSPTRHCTSLLRFFPIIVVVVIEVAWLRCNPITDVVLMLSTSDGLPFRASKIGVRMGKGACWYNR